MLAKKTWRGLTGLITAVLVSMTVVCEASAPVMGPFRMNFRSVTPCPGSMNGLQMVNFTVNTLIAVPGVSSTYLIDGVADLAENYDDSLSSIVSLSMIGKKNQLRSFRKMHFRRSCSAMLTNLQFVSELMKAAGIKPECPIPPGKYAIHNQTLTLERILIKEFFYAKWRMDVEILNEAGDTWGCVRVIADTVPR